MKKRDIKKIGKRGQETMGMPFSIIFSIILIIVFIMIAFVAIRYFLNIKKCSQVGMFYEDLEKEIASAQSSSGTSKDFKIELPSGIEKVCFADLEKPATKNEGDEFTELEMFQGYEANTFLLPESETCENAYRQIDYLDIPKIIASKNPYCVNSGSALRIEKKIYDKAVFVK